jgi:hypothetical protein
MENYIDLSGCTREPFSVRVEAKLGETRKSMRFPLLIMATLALFALSACEAPVTQISHTDVTVTEVPTGLDELRIFQIDRADATMSYKDLREKYEDIGVVKIQNKSFTFSLDNVPSDQCVLFGVKAKHGVGDTLAMSNTYWTSEKYRFTEGSSNIIWDKHVTFADNRKTTKDI